MGHQRNGRGGPAGLRSRRGTSYVEYFIAAAAMAGATALILQSLTVGNPNAAPAHQAEFQRQMNQIAGPVK